MTAMRGERTRVVRNETRDTLLHASAEFAVGAWRSALGWMFQSPAGSALIFDLGRPTPLVIHTFFVRGPLDALALDFELRVIAMVEHLRPFRVWDARTSARWLVELEAGTIATTRTAIGDQLRFDSRSSADRIDESKPSHETRSPQ